MEGKTMALTQTEAAMLVIQDEMWEELDAGVEAEDLAEIVKAAVEWGRQGKTLQEYALDVLESRKKLDEGCGVVDGEGQTPGAAALNPENETRWDEALETLGWKD